MICIHKWKRHLQDGILQNFAEIPIGTFEHEWLECSKCGGKRDLLKEFVYEKRN